MSAHRHSPSLYELLPRYVRFRDAREGEPLRAVMEALEVPYGDILEDIEALYRGWFAETCEAWRLPYIADLLGVRGLERRRRAGRGERTRVANTIAYRRHKGTPAALERAANDATDWPCRLREVRRGVATTAALTLGVPAAPGAVDVRRGNGLEHLGGAFEEVGRTVRLDTPRPPATASCYRGGNLADLALAFYRLGSYPVTGATPRLREDVAGERAGRCFTFHPFGLDAPLFNPPQTVDEAVYRCRPESLPLPLERRVLAREIAARRRGERPDSDFLGERPAFRILVEEVDGAGLVPLAPTEIGIADLADWRPRRPSGAAEPAGAPPIRAVVDPEWGRLMLTEGWQGGEVRVDYAYGAPMDLGGGPYPRPRRTSEEGVWEAVVSRDCSPGGAAYGVRLFRSLEAALAAFGESRELPIPPPRAAGAAPPAGVVRICDSGTYAVDEEVRLAGRRLRIEADAGCAPTVTGTLRVMGERRGPRSGSGRVGRESRLTLDGLWMEAGVRLRGVASVTISHSTVAPPRPGHPEPVALEIRAPDGSPAAADEGEGSLGRVVLARSVVGRLDTGEQRVELAVSDSLVDGGEGPAVTAPAATGTLERASFLGVVALGQLERAVDVLFSEPFSPGIGGEGVATCCRLPPGSEVPRRERCVEEEVVPVFTATTYGSPDYGRLHPSTDRRLLTGGEEGSEIGVFNRLRDPDRFDALTIIFEEYLPLGSAPRLILVT